MDFRVAKPGEIGIGGQTDWKGWSGTGVASDGRIWCDRHAHWFQPSDLCPECERERDLRLTSDAYRRAESLVHTTVNAFDRDCSRLDPSPLDMARKVAAQTEDQALADAAEATARNFGDWCGGRVEPSKVAERILYLYRQLLGSQVPE